MSEATRHCTVGTNHGLSPPLSLSLSPSLCWDHSSTEGFSFSVDMSVATRHTRFRANPARQVGIASMVIAFPTVGRCWPRLFLRRQRSALKTPTLHCVLAGEGKVGGSGRVDGVEIPGHISPSPGTDSLVNLSTFGQPWCGHAPHQVPREPCGSEAGSYLRLIDSCITQLKAQGPSRTCTESKEEEEPCESWSDGGHAFDH